ncbi:shematrin-like protein 1 [Aedes albopictus]|uniref:Secreted protein n=1 Tax=Aedes albopictus TaxID=7160 RepID=A0ABM1XJX2_AEDAL|nr:shematrin-like protein 1 [Aedes albopictus]XP_029734356.1 shematrin-like protein 1 [Aedes albopictus]
MVRLCSALLLVLSLAVAHAVGRHGLIGAVGKHKGAGSLATLGLGYGLGYGLNQLEGHHAPLGLYGPHPPAGLYYAPTYGFGHRPHHHHGHYGYPHKYGGYPKHGFHVGYEIGYQGKLGFVNLKRDNLRQVQLSFGLGKPQHHPKA